MAATPHRRRKSGSNIFQGAGGEWASRSFGNFGLQDGGVVFVLLNPPMLSNAVESSRSRSKPSAPFFLRFLFSCTKSPSPPHLLSWKSELAWATSFNVAAGQPAQHLLLGLAGAHVEAHDEESIFRFMAMFFRFLREKVKMNTKERPSQGGGASDQVSADQAAPRPTVDGSRRRRMPSAAMIRDRSPGRGMGRRPFECSCHQGLEDMRRKARSIEAGDEQPPAATEISNFRGEGEGPAIRDDHHSIASKQGRFFFFFLYVLGGEQGRGSRAGRPGGSGTRAGPRSAASRATL